MVTFVVRLWESAEPAPAAEPLRGTALHVASGRTTSFVGVEELLAFLTAAREHGAGARGRPAPGGAGAI
ncbi:MAG TPA: hypothetical protein VFR63_10620 [Gaiellaceae bacterium]|nr:hypothetical protein [Gaiellaceae bacterium]